MGLDDGNRQKLQMLCKNNPENIDELQDIFQSQINYEPKFKTLSSDEKFVDCYTTLQQMNILPDKIEEHEQENLKKDKIQKMCPEDGTSDHKKKSLMHNIASGFRKVLSAPAKVYSYMKGKITNNKNKKQDLNV
jgi:hypothetical protein